ncbi:transposase, partial [Candidatus Accumulibacter vicinus]|uniref:transposase n=1 Tax=Candidatus Accumulibacter vicinus TaxID=2954382 RepID=UPI00308111CF
MLENVQQTTLKPLILATIAPGTTVYTDEYDIYAHLPEWGDGHKTVCHSRGNPSSTLFACQTHNRGI